MNKKSGKCSNGHMTIGKGEMENITVGKGGGGCSTNSHMTVGKKGGGRLEGKGEGWERRRGERARDGLGRPVLFGPVG